MSARWVAGVTRSRALATRGLGRPAGHELAADTSLGSALRSLAATPYRKYLAGDDTLAEAQRTVSAVLLWHLRVLAGWLPRAGAALVRLLAAGFEIANIEDHLRSLSGGEVPAPYRLRSLSTAWNPVARTRAPAELRAVLSTSAWGDPGGESAAAIAVGLRISAAVRTAERVRPAERWAAGRTALLVGRERFVADRPIVEPTARTAARVLGRRAVEAATFADFRRSLPATADWLMEGVDEPGDLWRAEARWWAVVEQDGLTLLAGSRYDERPVVGAVAVLSADAWRVRAALELAARGGGSPEAADVLA